MKVKLDSKVIDTYAYRFVNGVQSTTTNNNNNNSNNSQEENFIFNDNGMQLVALCVSYRIIVNSRYNRGSLNGQAAKLRRYISLGCGIDFPKTRLIAN